jgi:hypothetical protein
LPLPGSPRFEALPWPQEVPILTDRDAKRYSLLEWLRKGFPWTKMLSRRELIAEIVLDTLLTVVEKRLGGWGAPLHVYEAGATPRERASLWNDTMRRLGYAVPEHSVDKPKKRKQQ